MFGIEKRPLTFNQMVGQRVKLNEFKKLSKDAQNKFSNVMLLSGPPGTGKTTSGYIIGKLLNCHTPVMNEEKYFEPCNECESCQDIINGEFRRDFHFINASSKEGNIEDIEKKFDLLNYEPNYDRNIIYLIDEAQGLSKSAKGLLNAEFEKERSNVYIIMCSMEPEKFHSSILQRVQQAHYKFKGLRANDTLDYLIDIFNSLPDSITDKVPESFHSLPNNELTPLMLIADYAEGSARMACNTLERVLNGEMWTVETIRNELNIVDNFLATGFLFDVLSVDDDRKKIVKVFEYFNKYDKETMTSVLYKIKTILINSVEYDITNYISDEWKRPNAEKLKHWHSQVKVKVFDMLNEIKTFPYVDMNTYKARIYDICHYIYTVNVPKK